MKPRVIVFLIFFLLMLNCRTNLNDQEILVEQKPTQTEYQRVTPASVNKVVTPTPLVSPTSVITSTPTISATPSGLTEVYIVQRGDTLGSISAIYNIPVAYLAKVNDIDDVNLIYEGQILKIQDVTDPTPDISKGKLIIVELSTQKLFAYENNILVKKFDISSGISKFPTRTGNYSIKLKIMSGRMKGDGYDIPDVPWIMSYDGDYTIHGAYWHDNFGMPMSHGCINMRVEDSKWLFFWAPIGTRVKIIN